MIMNTKERTLRNGMKIKDKPQLIYVHVFEKGDCLLCVRREGKVSELRISRKVAAELISSGFGYCD